MKFVWQIGIKIQDHLTKQEGRSHQHQIHGTVRRRRRSSLGGSVIVVVVVVITSHLIGVGRKKSTHHHGPQGGTDRTHEQGTTGQTTHQTSDQYVMTVQGQDNGNQQEQGLYHGQCFYCFCFFGGGKKKRKRKKRAIV